MNFTAPCFLVDDRQKAGRFCFWGQGNVMKRICRSTAIATLLFGLFAIGGCGPRTAHDAAKSHETQQIRRFTDDLGRVVWVSGEVKRIVSLAPNLTEMVFAVGAGERLVGVTSFCDFPAETASIEKVGDTLNPNMERIIALRPDIVLVSTASQIEAFTQTLEANGIAVYVTNPLSFQGVVKNLVNLGEIFGTGEKARSVSRDLRRRADEIALRVSGDAKVRVFVQISMEPLFTIGKQSYLNELIANAGGESVTSGVESAYPKLSKETASALAPEAIILSESDDNKEPNEVFRSSPAVRNGRIYRINADILSRPGPRLVDALEQIADALHPEKGNDDR